MILKWTVKLLFSFLLVTPLYSTANQLKDSKQAVVIKPYKIYKYNQVIKNLYANDEESHSRYLSKRLLADSRIFMGKPYQLGALGEGPAAKFDKEPLYRTDAFDCVTFVETVLALVNSDSFTQFRDHVLDIRYSKGIPTFLARNHFISVDWDPNNQRKGYITAFTRALFPNNYKMAVALINKPNWYLHLAEENMKQFKKLDDKQSQILLSQLRALGEQTKAVLSRFPYVPLTALFTKDGKPNKEMFAKIPNDVIIEIVRPNWDIKKLIGTNLNVSHLGFGIRINGVLYFREASSDKHKVVDIPLEQYLAAYLNSPTVKGISIQLIHFPKLGEEKV